MDARVRLVVMMMRQGGEVREVRVKKYSYAPLQSAGVRSRDRENRAEPSRERASEGRRSVCDVRAMMDAGAKVVLHALLE